MLTFTRTRDQYHAVYDKNGIQKSLSVGLKTFVIEKGLEIGLKKWLY